MRMINEAKEVLEDTLQNNDAIREEERVCMAEETIILSSDDNTDSETSKISSEPVTLSNKASTFTAEHKSDNEETPLKKTHAGPWTSKKEVLETIKHLHLKCGNKYYYHLYILTSRWLCLLQFETIGEEIYENLQNAYCTPLEFFVEKFFDVWDSEIHGPRNYLQSFYLAALIQKCGEKKHYPFAEIRNGI